MSNGAAITPERAQEIVHNLPVWVYRTTPDGRILESNDAVQDVLGYTAAEATQMNANDFYFDPKDRGPFMEERLEGSDVVRSLLRLRHKEGREVWGQDMGRAVLDADGKVLYFDGTVVDVTEKRAAEQALRDREEALATIHDKAPIAIFSLGPDGRVFQANPEAHRMLGLPDGGLLGKTISEFTYAEDAEESQQAFLKLKSGEVNDVAFDKRYRRMDNKAIWGHVRAVAIRDSEGNFTHTISLVQDITQRKRTEDAFRLLDGLTRQVNEAEDLQHALQAVLDSICTSIGFTYGEAWLPDDRGVLQPSPAWHGNNDDRAMLKFRHLTEKMTFTRNEGAPGTTYATGEPVWFEDLSHHQGFVRASTAAAAGLRCALGLPVRTGDQVVAVLMFLDTTRERPREHTMRLMRFLADRLGSTIARRRLEIRFRQQTQLMEAQIEGSEEAVLVTSQDGRILMVNRRFLGMCGVNEATAADAAPALELFAAHRDAAGFMDTVHHFYEDRTDGQGCVDQDGVSYHRRSVPLADGKGKVWYFRRVEDEDGS